MATNASSKENAAFLFAAFVAGAAYAAAWVGGLLLGQWVTPGKARPIVLPPPLYLGAAYAAYRLVSDPSYYWFWMLMMSLTLAAVLKFTAAVQQGPLPSADEFVRRFKEITANPM